MGLGEDLNESGRAISPSLSRRGNFEDAATHRARPFRIAPSLSLANSRAHTGLSAALQCCCCSVRSTPLVGFVRAGFLSVTQLVYWAVSLVGLLFLILGDSKIHQIGFQMTQIY